ncbi:MAG: septum formation initiator family protein [Armatimonadetes bacterium]|nr:septum formation initiator family protein [Armatimonadota bacterium]
MSYSQPTSEEPRRPRRRAPRRVVNYYVRIAGYATFGILGAFLVWSFVLKVLHPYQLSFTVGKEIRAAKADLQKQNARNAVLASRLAYLQTPEGAETEARRAGFARPGEQVYLIRTASPEPPATGAKEKP